MRPDMRLEADKLLRNWETSSTLQLTNNPLCAVELFWRRSKWCNACNAPKILGPLHHFCVIESIESMTFSEEFISKGFILINESAANWAFPSFGSAFLWVELRKAPNGNLRVLWELRCLGCRRCRGWVFMWGSLKYPFWGKSNLMQSDGTW